MKLFNQELDCLANLEQKLRESISVSEGYYAHSKSEQFRKIASKEIIETRKALVAVEAAKKALKKIEL